MMDDAVAVEAVAAGVGDKALHGPGLLLSGPTEQVARGEPGPAPPRDGDGKAAIGGVEQVAQGVGPHRITDLAVIGPVLPGEQPPRPNERITRLLIVHAQPPDELAQSLARAGLRPHPYQGSAPGLVPRGQQLRPAPGCTAGDRYEPLGPMDCGPNV